MMGLKNNFSVNVNAFDLITGYRADDSYFDYAQVFLNNGISVEQLACAMQLGRLGEQIVIKSKFAFSNLKYQEIYLSKAQSVLGDAFDYAVNTCGIPGNDFLKLFTESSVSKRMENGEPACVAGKSGIEIVREIVSETKGQELQIEPQEHFGRSKEYCIAWQRFLAAQWKI